MAERWKYSPVRALRFLLALFGAFPAFTQDTVPPHTNAVLTAIDFKIQRGHLMLPVKVAETNTLSFLLDTGYGVSTISRSWAERLNLKRAGELTIIGIAGREQAPTYEGPELDLGDITYQPRRLATVPSESNRRRDGILGSGFFRRFVVEIDSKASVLRLYDPKEFRYTGTGEILPLSFPRDTPVIDAAIVLPDREPIRARFEIDTGCDGSLCLGQPFVATHQLLEESRATKAGIKFGVGGSTDIRHGTLPRLQMGNLSLNDVSTSFFTDGSPAGDGQAGHIGMAALRPFKVIFDYANKRMILEKQ